MELVVVGLVIAAVVVELMKALIMALAVYQRPDLSSTPIALE